MNSSCRKILLLSLATFSIAACEGENAMPQKQANTMHTSTKVQEEIQPARGLNTERLFAEPIKGSNQRFARIESAVQNLSDEMDVISPAVIKLMAFEEDMHDLLMHLRAQREAEANGVTVAEGAPVQLAPLPSPVPAPYEKADDAAAPIKPEPVKKVTPSPIISGDGIKVIRLADHKDKTRLVFESGTKMSYTVDLDNAEKILIVDFAKGKNGVNTKGLKLKSKLIKSLTESAKGDEGFVLAFPLEKASRVLDKGEIPPGKENSNYRYYIDLAL